jgi:hypothetical protein
MTTKQQDEIDAARPPAALVRYAALALLFLIPLAGAFAGTTIAQLLR